MKYTNAIDAQKDHMSNNPEVFKENNRLVMAIIDAENELRDAVAESGTGVSNGSFNVTITPVAQRIYNEDKLHEFLSPTQFAQVVNDVTRPARITIGALKF